MKKRHSSIDGFIPRRTNNRSGDLHSNSLGDASLAVPANKESRTDIDSKPTQILGQPRDNYRLGRVDIDESLQSIDDINEPTKKLSRRQRRRLEKQGIKRPKSLAHRIIKWLIILIILGAISVGGYTAYKLFGASNNIFQGSILDILNNQPLKQDANGRSNFLIIGTSEDDPGHDGADLTDSIMVVSINQTTKNAVIFSIPRDLEVEYGMACIPGYSGKINAFYECVNDGTGGSADEQERLLKTRELVGNVLGMDIQYAVHVNYTVLKDVVNAIGGSITIDIQSDDPRGYLDSQLDYQCGDTYAQRIKNCPPSGHYVDYPNGPATLNAQAALNLARARGDSEPTYGFANANFEREKNQRKILIAIRDKALSNGTLTNLSAVSKLIDALGNNLRTNIQTSEFRTLISLTSTIKNSNIQSLDLLGDGIFNGEGNPVAGTYDFTQLREYLAKNLSSNPVTREAAPVMIANGTDQSGLGQTEADKLTAQGFNVASVNNADTNYDKTEVYQIGTGNTATAAKLASMYNTTVLKTAPPFLVGDGIDFLVIVGANAE
jgi:LCP family protein required for cell wall assembly